MRIIADWFYFIALCAREKMVQDVLGARRSHPFLPSGAHNNTHVELSPPARGSAPRAPSLFLLPSQQNPGAPFQSRSSRLSSYTSHLIYSLLHWFNVRGRS